MAVLWDVGDTVTLRTDPPFTNAAGTATDPTTITLYVKAPDVDVAVPYTYALAELTRLAAGDYSRVVLITAPGEWAWRWVGTGTAAASSQGTFQVRPTVTDP